MLFVENKEAFIAGGNLARKNIMSGDWGGTEEMLDIIKSQSKCNGRPLQFALKGTDMI